MNFPPHRNLSRVAVTIGFTVGVIAVAGFPLATPSEAAFPGYNGKILFYTTGGGSNNEGSYNLHVFDPTTSTSTVISTNADTAHKYPMWSPDGSRIAYSMEVEGSQEIAIMDSNGSIPTYLTNTAGSDIEPSWSPDGSKIAFSSGRDGNWEIYTMDADGGNQVNLTNDASIDRKPAWSPDGSKIAFHSDRGGSLDIYVMDANGGNVEQITTDPSSDGYVSWSPDGRKFLFSSNRSGGWDIFTMDIDGDQVAQLTSGPALDGESSWSPDGTKILFHSSSWLGYHVATIMDADGSNRERLTGNEFREFAGDWQRIPNVSPNTKSDNVTTSYSVGISVDVLANDTDEEALDPQYLTIASQPDHGTAKVVDGLVEYTPDTGFTGEDEVTYQICDSFLLDQKCATGVLAITVAAPNAPAVAVIKVGSLSFDQSANSYQTTERRPTFSGTADPFAEVRIEIHSDPIVLTTTADEDGNWSVTPDQDLPVGEHTVYITATKDGVTTELDSFVLGISQELPATGTDTTALRTSGALLIATGVGSLLNRRRRSLS